MDASGPEKTDKEGDTKVTGRVRRIREESRD
jgi:hypothetical protein